MVLMAENQDHLADSPADDTLPRRKALKRLAGGAIAGALVLSGCAPGAPTPVATATPSPTWTPAPAASSGDAQGDETPTASSLGPARDK
jgi:hypothetical protein